MQTGETRLFNGSTVDDITSYGPETTSVYIGMSGRYDFYVHDYTNRDLTSSVSMARSNVQVKLYIAGQDNPYVYNVPNQEGTLWHVFSISDGVVTPINRMSYESDEDLIGS